MSRPLKDKELDDYRKLVGGVEYNRQRCQLYQEAKSKKRYSKMEYTNTKERLQALKDKYKNGVPAGTIKAMVDSLM